MKHKKTPYINHSFRNPGEKTGLYAGLFVYEREVAVPLGDHKTEKRESKEMQETQKEIARMRRLAERGVRNFNKSIEGRKEKGVKPFKLQYNKENKKIRVEASLEELEKVRQANERLLAPEETDMLNSIESYLNSLEEHSDKRTEIIQESIKKDAEEYRKSTEGEVIPTDIEISNEELERIRDLILKKKAKYDKLVAGNPEKIFKLEMDESGKKIIVPATIKHIDDIQFQARDNLTKEERDLLNGMESNLADLQLEGMKKKFTVSEFQQIEEEAAKVETERTYDSQSNLNTKQEKVNAIRELLDSTKREYDQTIRKQVKKKERKAHAFDFVTAKGSGRINVSATIALINRKEIENSDTLSKDQKRLLANMKEQLEMLKDVASEREVAYDEYFLAEELRNLTEWSERAKKWSKRPGHQQLEGAFDVATSTPIIGTKEARFKSFWHNENGMSNAKGRESKELWFANVAEDTEYFKNSCPIPQEFQNNHEENRRRFPFMYHEWLKANGVDTDAMITAEQEVMKAKGLLAGIELSDIMTKVPETHPYTEKFKELESQRRNLEGQEENPDLEKITFRNYWRAMESLANDVQIFLDPDSQQELERYKKYAQKQAEMYLLLQPTEDKNLAFTREVLEQAGNRQLVVEISMRKFQKAMEMVDQPFGEGKGDLQSMVHPSVRHMFISMIYQDGVSRYVKNKRGEVEYKEDINEYYQDMMTEVATSPHFNSTASLHLLDIPSRKALKLIKVGAEVKQALNLDTERLNFLKNLKAEKTGKAGSVSPELSESYKDYTVAQIDAEIQRIENRDLFFEMFLVDVHTVIQDPKSVQARGILQKVEDGYYEKGAEASFDWKAFYIAGSNIDLSNRGGPIKLEGNIITGENMLLAEEELRKIEINYHSFELEEHSQMDILKYLGFSANAIYEKYLLKLGENPDLEVDNWNNLFKDDFEALYDLMDELIIGNEEIKPGAKRSFLNTFRKLKGTNPVEGLSDKEEGREGISGALAIYGMIKQEIMVREEIRAQGETSAEKINAAVRGMTPGDKIEKLIDRVLDDMFGPGKTKAQRAAGWILAYTALKGVLYAKNGKGGWATALKLLLVGTAIDVATDGAISNAIRDKAGMIAQNMEGTYEGALLMQGEEEMANKGITTREHAAAIDELKDVPFHKLMAWYKSCKSSGQPRIEGSKDLFPSQIDVGHVYKPKNDLDNLFSEEDQDVEARRICYATVKQFFKYTGRQKDFTANEAKHGQDFLEDVYINYYDKPNAIKPKNRSHVKQMAFLLDDFKGRRNELTFREVYRAIIDPGDVQATKGKNGLLREEFDYLKQMGEGALNWTEESLVNLSAESEEFFEDMGQASEDMKEFLIEITKEGAKGIHITKEKVVFWFEGHEYEIRRFFGNGLEIIIDAGTLVGNGAYRIADFSLDKGGQVLRQMNQQLGFDDLDTTKSDKGLTINDIIASGDESHLKIMDPSINPEVDNFGIYQGSFYEAFKKRDAEGNGFFVNTDPKSLEYPDVNVGYYLNTTKISDVHVSDPNDKDEIFDKLRLESREQAKRFYMEKDKNLTSDQIEKYMYPITAKVKLGTGSEPGEEMYVFWRMPMSNSEELFLKETSRWTDYMDPRRHMKRLPFKIDPTKGFIENMINGFGLRTDTTRTISGETAKWLSQSMNLSLHTIEYTGAIIAGGAMDLGFTDAEVEWIRQISERPESTKQAIDEFTTAAGTGDIRAMSDFYNEEENAQVYQICLAYARESVGNQELFLGIFDSDRAHESGYYAKKTPEGFNYNDLNKFYKDVWTSKERGNPKSEKFERLIKEKISPSGLSQEDLDAAIIG